MTMLKQFKKKRKVLKGEIKEARAHLKGLKTELKGLREDQQHSAVDRLDVLVNQRSSFIKNVKHLFNI